MATITTIEFLQALYPEPLGPGQLVIWTRSKRGGSKHSSWCQNLDHAARLAQKFRPSRDVHFGVALHDLDAAVEVARRRRPRAQKGTVRGCRESVSALPAVWADVDVAGDTHSSGTLPPTRSAALKLLEAVPAAPSIVVWTGGGFHVYWLLREPWVLETPEERADAERLVRRVQWALQKEARVHGWQIDHTADLGRLLRLPGTLNHKALKPLPVTIEHFPLVAAPGESADWRYDPSDFDLLEEPPSRDRGERPWRAGRGRRDERQWQPADFRQVYKGCGWIRHCYEDRTTLPEPEWYAALSIIGRCATPDADGRRLAHRISRDHPGYSVRKTDDKLDHALDSGGPRTCRDVAHERGALDAHCRRCPHFGKIRSPISLGNGAAVPVPVVPVPAVAASAGAGAGSAASRGRPAPAGATPEGASAGPEIERSGSGEDDRAQVLVDTREHEVNDQALAALAATETNLYERGGLLVHVVKPRHGDPVAEDPPAEGDEVGAEPEAEADASADRSQRDARAPSDHVPPEAGKRNIPLISRPPGTPVAKPIQEARLRELLSRRCKFVRVVTTRNGAVLRPAHPPQWAVRALLGRGAWPELPTLEGVVEGPVLRADGSVLQNPGYDPRSGLVYCPSIRFRPVPETPTEGDVEEALILLRETVCDFPFQDDMHFAAWLAALLTPLARAAFGGPSPLSLIDANVAGAGKSLLADVASTVLTGRPAARMSYSRDEEELRKAITGIALEATQLVLIDNVSGVFGSPTLDRALTAHTWRDRLLGSNDQVEIPLQVTWFATGNNVVLAGDTPRRCLHVRLDSPEERPERRVEFRHPHLLGWVRRHRGRILPAALTLLRAYAKAGRPAQGLPGWGSYESWSDLVRSAIVFLDLPDPADTREDLDSAADAEVGLISDLIAGTGEVLADLGGSATAREIVAHLARAENVGHYATLRATLAELFPRLKKDELPTASKLAFKLRAFRGRVVAGASIDRGAKSYRGVCWTVRRRSISAPSGRRPGSSPTQRRQAA